MDLAVRVTRPYEEVKEWLDNIKSTKLIVYQHDGDTEVSRTHIHMMIVGSELKPDALKARYKKLYGNIDAKDWSFKAADENQGRYLTYMSKGELTPKLTKNYDTDYVTNCMREWVEPKTNLKLEDGKFVRDIALPNQKTKLELLEQMRSKLCDSDTTRTILKIIRTVLIDNKVVIGQYKMMDYYDSLMMYSRKEEWLSGMERKIMSRQGI